MSKKEPPEHNANIHAPWRMEYIRRLDKEPEGCFICRAEQEAQNDDANLVLWRTPLCVVLMNRYPYTGGHLLIAPRAHKAGLEELDEPVLLELMKLTRDAQRLLGAVCRADGYNIGLNIGRCAGAGLPGHLHLHLVPRWSGDTNFMSVLADVRVIPQALSELHQQLLKVSREMQLPKS
jgi:ATP adenylyltransferase